MLFLTHEMVFGLDSADGIELVEISKAKVAPLETLYLLRKLFLHIVLLCKSKIANFDLHFGFVDENVVGLDIAMDKALLMNVFQSVNDLLK